MEGVAAVSALPDSLRAQVLADVKRARSPDLSATRRTNAVAVALGVATALAMIGLLGMSLGGRPLVFVVLSAVGWAAIAAVATMFSGSRGRFMLGPPRRVLALVALAASPAIFGWVMSCTVGWPELREPAGTWEQHVACLLATLLLSLGPVIALVFVRRGTDPVHPRATGAAIGAAAGAWGGVLIDMHCPLVHPLHVAVAHVMPVLLYAAVGMLLGARLLGVRRER
jgi:hypothetical protein